MPGSAAPSGTSPHLTSRTPWSEDAPSPAGAADWSYCFEGLTVDGDPLRVVVAFDGWMLVVTVVRLGGQED